MPTPRARAVGVDVITALDTGARHEVTALLELAQDADGYPSLSDQALLAVEDGDSQPSGPASEVEAVFLLAHLQGTRVLRGCALLEHRRGAWGIEMAIDPAHRRPTPETVADVEGALLDAALAEAVARGGGAVEVWGRTVDAHTDAVMAARGLKKSRELLQLRALLAPEAANDASSPPVPVRPFRPGRDETAWLEVNHRAFRDHPEQSSWTIDDLVRREREPWFDPGGFLLHEADGRLAGFCWTKVHRSPVLGEIYVIGVDPDFQGRGLGRSLARAGLGHLAARGISTAMLYVEGTNTPAIVLYRSLGFVEHHREVLFTGDLRTDSATSART